MRLRRPRQQEVKAKSQCDSSQGDGDEGVEVDAQKQQDEMQSAGERARDARNKRAAVSRRNSRRHQPGSKRGQSKDGHE